MADGTQENPYSVSGLDARLKSHVESGFSRIYIEGEISGWRRDPSGHAYFTLKDANAQISAVMFRWSLEKCKAAAALADARD